MRLYQRGERGTWWADFTVPGRPRFKRSSGTSDRRQAEEWAAEAQASEWRQAKLGERTSVTFGEATRDWLYKHGHECRSIESIKGRLRWITARIADEPLERITRRRLEELMDLKRREGVAPKKKGAPTKPVRPGTLNTYVAEVSKILNHARRQEWITHVPALRRYDMPTPAIRWVTRTQAERLIEELPAHLADMALFALMTGIRESNLRLLRWEQIDLGRGLAWVEASDSKNKRPINVPLNQDALDVLRRRRHDHSRYVFVYDGHPVVDCSTAAWYKAVKRAGLHPLRWHDLRHTWASWHVQQGTPLPVLQQLGGWSSYAMVLRYAHLAIDHTAAYAHASALRYNDGTTAGGESEEIAQVTESMVPLDGIELSTFALRMRCSTD